MLGDDLDAMFDDCYDDDSYIDCDDNTGSDDPVDTSTGYGAAALAYRERGWQAVLPLPRGEKFPPPRGYTGAGAATPSHADVFAWTEDHPEDNLALRMPDGVVGIDVDAYPGKRGGATLAAAEAAWGPLPPTVRSSSRDDDPDSGIRFYRGPDGTRLVGQIAIDGTSDIEVVQPHHRYAVVYPSVHPSGAMYRWRDAAGALIDIPAVDDLPTLPDRWVAELTAAPTPSVDGITVDVASVLRSVPDGTPDHVVRARLEAALADLRGGGSRHDTTVRHVLALLRCASDGRAGVRGALTTLHRAFVEAVVGDGRDEAGAHREYVRMLTNRRGHALIAATPTMDFDDLADLAEPATPPPSPPPSGNVAAGMPDDGDDAFWSSRDSLVHIRDTARSRLTAPWAVLGAVLVRTACTIPYTVTLPPLIGGPASLNTFCALVGPSGSGKGGSSAVAAELVPHDPTIATVEVGSGEGLAHQYVRRATVDEQLGADDGTGAVAVDANGMVWQRRAALFIASEVDTLGAVSGRTGATLMSKLRNGWSGEELGFGYATREKALLVGSHGYRMGLTVGVQPQRAAALLDEAAGGTPQRFIWVWVTDPTLDRSMASDAPIVPIAPVAWPLDPWSVPVPTIAADAVMDAHIARQRGEGDALDGHAMLARLKVMALLAVIDGRIEPNDSDWELAGHVMDHSARVRREVADELVRAARSDAVERGLVAGIERDAASGSAHDEKLERVCGVVLRGVGRLTDKGKPATEGNIGRLVASRDRDMKDVALEALVLRGALVRDKAGAFAIPT